jgi:hypothetical protein
MALPDVNVFYKEASLGPGKGLKRPLRDGMELAL